MATLVDTRDTVETKELKWGHKVVGASAVQLTALEFKFTKGLLIRAPGTGDTTPNTNPIWIGGKGVTANSNVGTGGVPLLPGESINLPVDDPTEVYVISDAATQDVAWMGV
jgi:hypothetical protein